MSYSIKSSSSAVLFLGDIDAAPGPLSAWIFTRQRSVRPASSPSFADRTMDLIGRRERCRSGPFTTRGLTVELLGRGIKSDRRAVWVFLHAEGLSFKKTVRPAEQMRPDIARKRTRWKARQGRVEPGRLVFIDETWAKTNMAPLRGWDRADERLRGSPAARPCVDAPSGARRIFETGAARDRVLPCVRPLMRHGHGRGPVWEFGDQVHITGTRSKRSPCAWFS